MSGRMTLAASVVLSLATATAWAGPPDWHDNYRYDRKALDRDFDRREDELRDSYKALREREEDAWKHARKSAPPQARKYINQQYSARRKALERDFDAQRKSLDHLEDRTRDAIRDGYRNVHEYRAYPTTPRYFDTPYEYRGYAPPRYYEELPPPVEYPPYGYGRDI